MCACRAVCLRPSSLNLQPTTTTDARTAQGRSTVQHCPTVQSPSGDPKGPCSLPNPLTNHEALHPGGRVGVKCSAGVSNCARARLTVRRSIRTTVRVPAVYNLRVIDCIHGCSCQHAHSYLLTLSDQAHSVTHLRARCESIVRLNLPTSLLSCAYRHLRLRGRASKSGPGWSRAAWVCACRAVCLRP